MPTSESTMVAYRLIPLCTVLAFPLVGRADDFSALSRSQVVDLALVRNPIVVESKLEWDKARAARSGVAGVLAENPALAIESGRRRDPGFSSVQASVGVRAEQPLDLFGQAGARRGAADSMIDWAKSRWDLARAEIAARAGALYVAAQATDALVSLRKEQEILAASTVEALRTRVRLGASSDIDLRLAEAEHARARAAVAEAERQSGEARLALREWLNLPVSAVAAPVEPLMAPPAPPSDAGDNEALFRAHPAVAAIDKRRLAIDSEIERLRSERMPRLSLGIMGERPTSGENYVGIGLSFAPALWRRNQGPIAEAKVEVERADFERTTTLASMSRQLSEIRRAHAARVRELAALERAIADQETAADLSRVGFEAGKFDFFRVLLARRGVAEAKEARVERWAALWLNLIETHRLLGRTL